MRRCFFILILGTVSAQWYGETATTIDERRKEIGLFSPFRMGLRNGTELSVNKFLLMPNVSIKQERPSIREWEIAQRFQLEYPTIGMKWLQSPMGDELGDPDMFALISPQFNIPQMVSIYGELIGTNGLPTKGILTIRGGLGFGLGGNKLSNDATIDLPIIYPRLSIYYNGILMKVGGDYYREFRDSWSYVVDYDMFVMPGGRGRYTFEHKMLLVWSKSQKFRFLIGYKLIAGEYPFGAQAHLLPALDVQFGW